MRFMLVVSFILLSLQAVAQLRTQPTPVIPFASHIELAKASELESITKMRDRLSAGDRSLCHYNRRISVSRCALQMIRVYRVHSSQGLRSLLDLSVASAVVDRAQGLSEIQINRDLAENFLAIAENARPAKFFAVRMHARSKRDRLEKTQARIAENASLENFRLQVLPLIATQITKSRSWSLQARVEKLRVRRWAVN